MRGEASLVTTLTPTIPAGAHENLSCARSTARMSTGYSQQLRLTSLKGEGAVEMGSSCGKYQRGFSLVAAVFIIVVLAILGLMMVTIGGMERATADAAAQGARAYYAARAGIEWGAFQAVTTGSCPASASFSLPVPGLNGFTVAVNCTATAHRERSATYNVYAINSTATFRNFGTADYISRTLRVTVTDAPP